MLYRPPPLVGSDLLPVSGLGGERVSMHGCIFYVHIYIRMETGALSNDYIIAVNDLDITEVRLVIALLMNHTGDIMTQIAQGSIYFLLPVMTTLFFILTLYPLCR